MQQVEQLKAEIKEGCRKALRGGVAIDDITNMLLKLSAWAQWELYNEINIESQNKTD